MALVLTIGGANRTSVLKANSLRVEHRAAGFVSVCSLILIDENHNIAISDEDSITVVDGATTFFSGRVVDVQYKTFTTASRNIVIKCQDLNAQLIETVVDDEEVFTAEADADIIDALFVEYLSTVDSETHVNTIQDPLTITMGPCTLRSALSQICTRTGGYFYIDFDNKLHYFDAEANVSAWWLSDDPDQVDSFSYFPKPTKSMRATKRLDGVFVVGDGVEGWRGSHGAGDRTAIVRDNRITTTTGVNERGDAILTKFNTAQVVYKVKTYKAGLLAGMDVRFICALYGVDDTFTVRKMTVKWDTANDAYYDLELGDPVNLSLTGERKWTDALEDALGPITAPRLPTSSKGWSHDLVFSATDEDTVEWAAGGSIYLADGTTYAIDAGDTANMAADTIYYIFLDLDSSDTVLQKTTDSSVAVGAKKILIATAWAVEAGKDAGFQVFGGSGIGLLITADNIAANTITANEIAANTIVAGNIAAGAIETDELAANAVTAGKIAANTITANKLNIGDLPFTPGDGSLLLGPFGEISSTAWWSLRRQKATISGVFNQVAGRWIGTRAQLVEAATTNIVGNPSFEVNVTDWWATTFDGTSERVITEYSFGIASNKLTVGAGKASVYIYKDSAVVNPAQDATYTIAAWFKPSPDTIGNNAVVGISESGGATGLESSTMVVAMKPGWQKVTHTRTVLRDDRTGLNCWVRPYGAPGEYSYADGVQLEEKAYATSYCDGDQGAGYAWTGTHHNSTSTRVLTEINLDALVDLISAKNTLSFRVVAQMPHDADGSWIAPGPNYIFDCYSVSDRLMLHYDDTTDRFDLWIDGLDRLSSPVQTFKAGDWMDIVVTLNFTTDNYIMYINGVEMDTDTTALAAQVVTDWTLGSDYAGAGYVPGFAFAEYAAFDRVLTAIEVAELHALGQPLIDTGAYDKPGIYILDGKFKIASSTTGNRIEITPDEIAGYSGIGVKEFYLRASDGIAVCGGGIVTLSAAGIRLEEGTEVESYVAWFADGEAVGWISADWGGGAGDEVVTWVVANEDLAAAGAMVTLRAVAIGESDVRLRVNSDGTIDATAVTNFALWSGAVGWLDFEYGANYLLRFGDAAGGDKFLLKDSGNVTVLEVDSDGATRISKGLHVGDQVTAPTDNDISAAGDIKVDLDARIGMGLHVGNNAVAPVDNNITCDGDMKAGRGLYVGNAAGVATENDIVCEGTLKTALGIEWDFGGASTGVVTADSYLRVRLGAANYYILARAT